MKLLLLGNYLYDQQTSMQLFARILLDRLRIENEIHTTFIQPKAYFGKLRPDRRGAGKWLGYLDKYVLFPKHLRRALVELNQGGSDRLLHICDQGNSYYARYAGKTPVLITCHDVIAIMVALGYEKWYAMRPTGRQYQKLILNGLRKADYFSFVSENSRRDMHRLFLPSPDRERVIYNQLAFDYRPMRSEAAAAHLLRFGLEFGERFVLHVGSSGWNKNRIGALRIFSRVRVGLASPCRLVMIGPPFDREMTDYIQEAGIGDHVVRASGIPPETLNALYSTAAVFIFPSKYEGFGWPPVEAQAAGCPVVAGVGGSLREVLADSALLADAEDEPALVESCLVLIRDREFRGKMIEAGLRNAERFKSPAMVDNYLEYYRQIFAGNTEEPVSEGLI